MTRPIQAGSLASLIDLAENPPDQPLHSSTDELQQPLVLYIARKNSPSHFHFVGVDRERRDIVSVLLCSPRLDNADLEKYNRSAWVAR